MSVTAGTSAECGHVDVAIVDCDVHVVPAGRDELLSRMPEPWRSRMGTRRANAGGRATYHSLESVGKRGDAYPASGAPAGSEPGLVYRQLFGDAGVDIAMLLPEGRLTVDPELNAAWCSAHNTWVADTWLGPWNLDNRFYGAISISIDDPVAAVREIETWAGHPGFKQILIGEVSGRPLGFPQFEPVWAAAARHRLPVAMHFGGNAAQQLGATPVGTFLRHIDFHPLATPLVYSAHLVSWLCSGVFDRHPDLVFVLVEGGFLWHRPVLARIARQWETFRAEVMLSSDDLVGYLHDHVRFTTQPIEEADDPRDVVRLMELADADRLLMLSSDYPHYDFDHPLRALPRGLPADTRRRIMSANARELYDLPATRAASPELDGTRQAVRL
jgi:uncharacterized protein